MRHVQMTMMKAMNSTLANICKARIRSRDDTMLMQLSRWRPCKIYCHVCPGFNFKELRVTASCSLLVLGSN
jgi:hypothetical protein